MTAAAQVLAEAVPTVAVAFQCPECRAALTHAEQYAHCAACGADYPQIDGVWRMLAPSRVPGFARFMAEYERVRQAEGRGSDQPDYYRALPYADLSGRFQADWQIRARSFDALLRYVVTPLERQRRLRVIDIGAGCGWLAERLMLRGHSACAIDLMTDARDGLGAHVHFTSGFVPIQAEFERIPLADGQTDLLVVNAAFHYATNYSVALREALRVLAPGGTLAIVDTPVYHDPNSGVQMLRERGDAFERTYGFRGEALPYEGYLTYDRIAALGRELGLQWRIHWPNHGLRWALRPLRAKLRGRREPAAFPLLVATRV